MSASDHGNNSHSNSASSSPCQSPYECANSHCSNSSVFEGSDNSSPSYTQASPPSSVFEGSAHSSPSYTQASPASSVFEGSAHSSPSYTQASPARSVLEVSDHSSPSYTQSSPPISVFEGSAHSSPSYTQTSPPSSTEMHGIKRFSYGAYKDDPTILVPRQTLDRWKKMRGKDQENEEECLTNESLAPQISEVAEVESHQSNLDICSVLGDNESHFNSGSDDSDSESISNDSSNPCEESLYLGCPKSKDEAIFEIINIYLRKKLSKHALKDILKMYVTSLPPNNVMPSSVHNLLQYVQMLSMPLNEREHYYCRPAMHSVDSRLGSCTSCGSVDIGLFCELPLENTLKFMFEQRGLADLIDQYSEIRRQRGDNICDITDGSEYRRVWFGISNKYKVTLILNTDGVSPHSSSKARFWPLMFSIMEVPPRLRSLFTFVWGIWFDRKLKPDMNLYLKPFVSSLVKIHGDGGVSWKDHSTGLIHVSPIRAPIIVADAPARASVLNMQEHQAKYGCNACEQKTSKLPAPPTVPGEKKKITKRRFLFKEEAATLRTNDRMLLCGSIGNNLIPKRGIKGLTVIRDIPSIDLSTCVIAEYMHCVLLGVVRQICSLWMFVKGAWYVGDHLNEINKFIGEEIYPPDTLSRLPRSFEYFAHFKANEFRSYLLFFSLVVVAPYLKDEYHQHWLLFVQAIFLLVTESISENDLMTAEVLLRLFVRDLGTLYNDEQYVYNVHQLLHLVLYVRRWGCLWSNSAFSFESMNGTLSEMIHGSKNEGRELLNRLSLAHGNQMLKSKIIFDSKKKSGFAVVVGSVLKTYNLTDLELNLLKDLNVNTDCLECYGRILVGTETFSSQEYDKSFRRRNSYVEIQCGGRKMYGRIAVFCKSGDSLFCILSVYNVDHTKFFFHRSTLTRIAHIIPVEKSEEVFVCKVENIVQKLIQVGSFLCFLPNSIERNL